MSEYAVQGKDLKKIIERTKNNPLPFAFNLGKSNESTIFCLHKTKPMEVIYKAVKNDGEGKKTASGSAELVEKTLRMTCDRVIPQMAKQVKRYLKSQKVMIDVEVLDIDGNLVDSDAQEEEANEPDVVETNSGNEPPAEASSPGKMKPLDPERAALATAFKALSPRIKALPPRYAEQLGKYFQAAIAKTKAGKIEDASNLVAQIESALNKVQKSTLAPDAPAAKDDSKTSSEDPARVRAVQALRVRMVKLDKEKVPAMLVRQKAQTLQKAKTLVDNDKLDDAKKLLDTFEAQVARPEQAPKANWADNDPERVRAVQALRERLVKLAKKDTPETLKRQKAQTLQKAKGLVDSGKMDEANKLLDAFEAAANKKAPPRPSKPAPDKPPSPEMKKRAFQGADFSSDSSMKGPIEKITEELFALINLIDEKTGKMSPKKKKVWDPKKTECTTLISGITNADGDRKNGYKALNEKAIDHAYDKFTNLVKKKQTLQSDLKPLWLKDQKKQLQKEIKKNKQSSSKAMSENFGESFMEMAQMAEVMAKNIKFDPFNAKDGGVSKPMEMGEIAAIYGYSTQDYTKLNQLLRDDQKPGDDKDKKDREKHEPYIKACTSGLEKLPPYTGEAVRCDKTAKYFLGDLVKTGIRTEKAFMSTGKTEVPGFGKIVTNVTKIKTGKDISAFSLHQKEGEVLFPPGSSFKFVKFEGKHEGKAKVITNHAALKDVVNDSTEEGVFYFEQVK